MKVALTGVTGFIGHHMVDALARLGLSPTLVVRPTSVVPSRLRHHQVVRIDLLAPPPNAFDLLGRPDLLIHLAWGGLPNYQSLHHFERELPAQYMLLKSMLQDGLPRLLVTGTCFEYGEQSGPLSEDMNTRPTNPYGFAKDMLRQQLQYLQRELPFELTWARLFYLYGEGQAPTALLAQLRRAVASGETHFPMSGGEQLRDYLDVTEAANHLAQLASGQRGHGLVNLCSGRPISVRRLVEGWIKTNRWSIRPDLGRYPDPSHEPLAFWGDATKLNHCLQSL